MVQHQFSSLLSEYPSDAILRELMKTVESFGMLKGSILTSEYRELFSDILTIRSLYYYQALNRNDITCKEILLALHANDNNDIYTYAYVYQQCREYARTLKGKQDLILPTDFVRINEAIKCQDTSVLSDMDFFKTHEKVAQHQSNKLKLLYEESLSKFLNISVANIPFVQSDDTMELGALELMYGAFINEQESSFYIPLCLSKWEIINDCDTICNSDESIEKTIINMLAYFHFEFNYMAALVSELNIAIYSLNSQLAEVLSKIHSNRLTALLSNSLCFRYSDFISALGITYKTAIDYLMQLESHGFISNTRIGREKVFTNDHLFSLLREVESDGS